MVNEQIIARFWAMVNKTESCWLWTGSVTRIGYGQFAVVHGKNVSAHRFAWFLSEGELPYRPFGVLHHCDVRRCVNRAHLWKGTQSDNLSDAALKGRLAERFNAVA